MCDGLTLTLRIADVADVPGSVGRVYSERGAKC